MTETDIQRLATAAAEAATGPLKRPLAVIAFALFALGGSGGTWAYRTDTHEQQQDKNIARNGRTIRQISVLLVQQGRHFERMARAAAAGQPIPSRPPELNMIESKILEAAPVD